MSTTPRGQLHWINILFFTITPLVGVVGTAYLIKKAAVPPQTWWFSVIYLMLTGLAITAGYHRLLAHKAYQARPLLQVAFLLMGAGAFEGSALEWCCDHRNHHRYLDQELDPYSIQKGFWHAHLLWLFQGETLHYNFSNVQDLQTSPLIRWQQKYYLWLAILMGFVFPTAVASLWGDPLGGLVIAGALRMTINHHVTFAINSVCHCFGKRTYAQNISARDNWLTSLFTYGEGFHNFHHQFPGDYRNGIRFFHYDLTKWFIVGMSMLGLAKELKRVDPALIHRYRQKAKVPTNQSAG